jgi:hypothetical protein
MARLIRESISMSVSDGRVIERENERGMPFAAKTSFIEWRIAMATEFGRSSKSKEMVSIDVRLGFFPGIETASAQ